jgi:hypothetical protein
MKTIQSLGFAMLLAMSLVVGPRVALGQWSAIYTINGTSGNDLILVAEQTSGFKAWVNGVQVASGTCSSACTFKVYGKDGNDSIYVSFTSIDDTTCKVYGENGSDYIKISGCEEGEAYGGAGSDDFVLGTTTRLYNGSADGGSGHDHFCYNADQAFLYGGTGDDYFGDFNEENCQQIHSGIVAGEEDYNTFYGGYLGSHNALFVGGPEEDQFLTTFDSGTYYSYISCEPEDYIHPAVTYGTISGCSP